MNALGVLGGAMRQDDKAFSPSGLAEALVETDKFSMRRITLAPDHGSGQLQGVSRS
jgi:hypothetical protein